MFVYSKAADDSCANYITIYGSRDFHINKLDQYITNNANIR